MHSKDAGLALSLLLEHGTGPVSDALDLLGVNGGLEGLTALYPSAAAVGPAFTLKYREVAEGEKGPAGDYIDDVPPGSVIVIANDGRLHCTVWGGILSAVAQEHGVAGTVIDGCCRDVPEIVASEFPLFSRGKYMKSGKNRVRLIATEVDVTIGDVVVRPGDIVCGDGSGVVVVPSAQLDAVADLVVRIVEMEQKVLADALSGTPLRDARARHGYNMAPATG